MRIYTMQDIYIYHFTLSAQTFHSILYMSLLLYQEQRADVVNNAVLVSIVSTS